MGTIVFTGFPGFLGSALLPRVLEREPASDALCIVQPRYVGLAYRRLEQICLGAPFLEGRVRIAEGDITEPDLGLGPSADLQRRVQEIYHLAAIYDLAVPHDLATRVNVEGTRHVLELASNCPELERLQYVSTCYVSGRYPGIFSETDLDRGQSFNNHYEETKYLAEVAVRDAMSGGLPATIYRPSIVVGDSETGETQKYDGPYYVIRLLLKQRGVAVMPVVGDPSRSRLNLVPRDYVIDAMTVLSGLPHTVGRTYHLADPNPLTVGEVLEVIESAVGTPVRHIRLPLGLARAALVRLPAARSLLGMPAEALDYFVHPTFYATAQATTDLDGSGVTVPAFSSYADRLVRFVRGHPDLEARAMA